MPLLNILINRTLLYMGFTLINTQNPNCQPIIRRMNGNYYVWGCTRFKSKPCKFSECPYSMDSSHWEVLK